MSGYVVGQHHQAPDPQVMKTVPQAFRNGTPAPYSQARAYTDGLGPGNVTARDVGGCYQFTGACSPFGCLCVYNYTCGDDCGCMCPCVFGIPTVFCLVALPFCERDGNAWVNRDKNGIKTGETILVDKEMGTYACYSVKCCSSEFNEQTDCVANKCCGSGGVPVQ